MNPMRENVENVFGYFCKELCLKRFPLTAIAVFERTSTFKDCVSTYYAIVHSKAVTQKVENRSW